MKNKVSRNLLRGIKIKKNSKEAKVNNKVCVICNKMFYSSWKKAKYCSYSCRLKANRLRCQKSAKKPNGATWLSIVEFINERDNYECVKCSSDKKIEVHHKKMLCEKGTNSEDNLMTLCHLCHMQEHKI